MQLTHQPAFKQDGDEVGLGWGIVGLHHEILYAEGQTGGFRSSMMIDLKHRVAVVMLSNTAILSDKIRGLGQDVYTIMKYAESHKE